MAIPMAQAQEWLADYTARWGNHAPRVELIASANDLPAAARQDAGYEQAVGYYDGKGRIYINLDRIGSERQLREVLAHEAIGHHGIKRIVGAKEWTTIEDGIARRRERCTGGEAIQAAIAEVERRVPGLGRGDFAREVIAVMAESDGRPSVLVRALAATRRFLRRLFPRAVQWSDADLRGLLASATAFVHRRNAAWTLPTDVQNEPMGRFSKVPSTDAVEGIEAALALGRGGTFKERAAAWLHDLSPGKVKDATRKTWLGALTTRHLTELGADYFGNIRHYSDFLSRMASDRNLLQAEAEGIAEQARKWVGKNKVEAARLFDLMHKATLHGPDPSTAYQPLRFRWARELHEVNEENIQRAIDGIREQMRGRPGDPKQEMMDRIRMLRSMRASEPHRRATYPQLVRQWNELSPDAQKIYKDFRDLYAQRFDETEKALLERIDDLEMEKGKAAKLKESIRYQFETQRLQGVYFPLQRFGKYFISVEKDGDTSFLKYERLNDLERAEAALKERGFAIIARGQMQDSKASNAPSGTFVAEVIEKLQEMRVSENTQDEIYQLYLNALPELSMRKHAIHRKGVPGFDPDAVRAFAWNMHHQAHQLARLRYAHKLQDVLQLLRVQQKQRRETPEIDVRKVAAGDAIIDELGTRHEWIMNPQDKAATNLISSIGFTYYLGLTPAAALVNLSQTAMITYPYLAARYGPIRAMRALLSAGRDAGRTLGNMQRTLNSEEERDAHAALEASGALDKTQAHNLAGIAEGGSLGYNPTWARVMEIVGWGFHKTEVINREASGMAAFRLARAAGESFDAAVRIAADTIYDTHYDYSNANRARFMQSGTAKVLLMFRQYSLNTTWHLGRMLWQATQGESPQVRQLARRNLAGVLGMAGLFGGVMGLPTVSVTMGVLNAIAASFGDDDEPWDAETEFRNFLADMLGPSAAQVVATGPVNRLTGADIAARVTLDELWFRDPDRELEGRGLYYHLLEQAAGPMGGTLKNAIVGKSLMDDGHLWRGVETVLPKAMKDTMKAIRYAREGVQNLKGHPVIEDVSLWQALLQGSGFTPAQVSEQYTLSNKRKVYEEFITGRRQDLMNAYAMAIRQKDAEAVTATIEKMRAYNRANPDHAITPATIRRSMKSRERYAARATGGIVLNPKLQPRVMEAVRF